MSVEDLNRRKIFSSDQLLQEVALLSWSYIPNVFTFCQIVTRILCTFILKFSRNET